MRTPTREELAWAAGIHCGEGGIYVNRTNTKKGPQAVGVRFSVGQASHDGAVPEMLLRLQTIFGTGTIHPLCDKRPNRKAAYQFQICGFEKTQAVMAMVWEWLTPEKKNQAEKTFKTWKEAHACRV